MKCFMNNLFFKKGLVLVGLCLLFFLPGIASLPPFDRDEARYMQATKQMLESGNYVDIRFQEETRYKKPVGIYWLQAASVNALSPDAPTAVWPYRLVSVVAASLAVLLAYLVFSRLFSPGAGFTASLLLAGSIGLSVEAHLAKTDAALLACTLACLGAFGVLLLDKSKRPALWAALFWVALALGILIKGPLLPLVLGLTGLSCLFLFRPVKPWLTRLGLWWGLPLALLLIVPWFWLITQQSGGAFWQEFMGKDVLGKAVAAQESHGGFPGYYLLCSLGLFLPASLFTILAAPTLWKERHEAAIKYCLAWLLPAWLFFELMPTKLPHYVLPLFPALLGLTAYALHGPATQQRFANLKEKRFFAWGVNGVLVLLGLLSFTLLLWYPAWLGKVAVVTLAGLLALAVLFAKGNLSWLARGSALVMGLIMAAVFGLTLPDLLLYSTSSSLQQTLHVYFPNCEERSAGVKNTPRSHAPVMLVGYNEPSAVFLLGTNTLLLSPDKAAAFLAHNPPGSVCALVVSKNEEPLLEASLLARNLSLPKRVTDSDGFNYSSGDWTKLHYYDLSKAMAINP